MSVEAAVAVDIDAREVVTSGLTSAIKSHPLRFVLDVGDCTVVWSDRRACGGDGHDDIDLSEVGVSNVKVLCVRNLSSSSAIAMTAGWNGAEFRNFATDVVSWNFAPMVNLGSLSLRGYPIRPLGSFLLSCPNSTGFATTTGGSLLRIGGPSGTEYEIHIMGN
jgi:hypothetical protein